MVPLSSLVEDGRISYGIVQPGGEVAGGIPIVRVKDLKNGVVDTNSPLRVAPEVSERHARTVLRGGEVLLSLVGTIGEAAVAPPQLAGWNVARAIAVIRPKEVEAEWLRRCFKVPSVVSYLDAVLNTTVQATLNLGDLGRLLLPLPDEQFRVGVLDLLGALDEKVAANHAAVVRMLHLSELLVSRTTTTTMLRERVELSGAVNVPEEFGSSSVWHYSLPRYDEGQSPSRDRASDIKSAKYVLSGPSTLISKLNPRIPRVWDVPVLRDGVSVASTEFVVLKASGFSSSVLRAVLAQPGFRREVEGKVSGTSGSHQRVKPDDLLKTEVIDPLAIPESVRAQVTDMGLLADQLRVESDALTQMRETLLPQLLSGNLRVKDAKKQVEAVV